MLLGLFNAWNLVFDDERPRIHLARFSRGFQDGTSTATHQIPYLVAIIAPKLRGRALLFFN